MTIAEIDILNKIIKENECSLGPEDSERQSKITGKNVIFNFKIIIIILI